MGINYYNKRRDKILRDIDQYTFDTEPLNEQLDTHFDDISSRNEVAVSINYLLPYKHSPQVRWFYQEGDIKSHEYFELLEDIRDQIKNALHSKVSNLTKSFTQFPKLLDSFKFHYALRQGELDGNDRQIIQVKIEILKPPTLSFNLLSVVIHSFFPSIANFSENISIEIKAPNKKKPIIQTELSKESKKEEGNFLTLDDKDEVVLYYAHEEIKKYIFEYFYPIGQDNPATRITLDKLQKKIPVHKSLRIQRYKDDYVKLAEYITPYMSNHDLSIIIRKNDIEGFYSGVIDIDGNLRYMVFDIDVSSFLRGIIHRQTIWELVLSITDAIIDSVRELGIKGYPVVKFSGSRGVHIVYRYDNEVISDEMNRLDLDNYFYHFPGLWNLLKTSNSPLRSKTSFSRLLADAIVIKTIFMKTIEIPDEIRSKLGITHQRHLFKLSSFSSNEIGILLDTSPCSKGVFRAGFSLHPTTGLASIPLNSTETGEIFENYLRYDELRDEATTNNIQHHLRFEDEVSKRYGQLKDSAVITRAKIEQLLKPQNLLPFIAIVLRFTRRFAIERKVGSFYYWYNYYTLKFAFEYIKKIAVKPSEQSADSVETKVMEIADKCQLATKKQIKQYLNSYLEGTIPYPIFKDRMDGLYHFEFYYEIAPSPIPFEEKDTITKLLENQNERKYFLQRFQHVLSIVLNIFSIHKDKLDDLSERQVKVLKKFYQRITKFEKVQEVIRAKIGMQNKETFAIRELLLIITMYNLLVKFMKEFYNFTHISVSRRGNNDE